MRRSIVTLLAGLFAACSAPDRSGDAEVVARAARQRLLGHPAAAVDPLRQRDHLAPEGLAELGRAELACGRIEEGRDALDRRAAVAALAFDADGRHLAIGSVSGIATQWDLATQAVHSVTPRAGAPIARLAYGAGGELATASHVRRESIAGHALDLLAVWTRDGARAWSRELGRLEGLAYRPGTDVLATASLLPGTDNRGITLWSASGVAETTVPGAAAPLAWSTDGVLAHAPDDEPAIALRSAAGKNERLDLAAVELAFAPGGRALAVGESSGRLSIWDTASLRPISATVDPAVDEANAPAGLAWSRDGAVLASAAGSTVRLWDPRTAAPLATFTTRAGVTAIAFHPGGRFVAVGADNGTVELWAVATATLIAILAVSVDGERPIVMAPDGAVDGTLAVSDPLFWRAGGATAPGLGAWERARLPGRLAARRAPHPAHTSPRPAAAPQPPPRACFDQATDRGALTSWWLNGDTLQLCVARDTGDAAMPTCFSLDVASGIYRPRAPSAGEILRRTAPDPATASATHAGARVKVCRAGRCRTLGVPEITALAAAPGVSDAPGASSDGDVELAVNHDASLVAVWSARWGHRGPAVVYDVASGRRLSRIALDRLFDGSDGVMSLEFVGDTLLATSTPCAGPCSSSVLIAPRTGKRIAAVGGREPLNTSETMAAQVAGDVFAFNDWDSSILVYQDVRTGRVVRRFDGPTTCSSNDCGRVMLHLARGLAVLPRHGQAGDVTVLDPRGHVIARHHLPSCP